MRNAIGLFTGLIAACVLACASPVDRFDSSGSSRTDWSCSRANPLMQSAVLEAVVAGGGPLLVDVAGWMCGRISYGVARVVMLRYTPEDPKAASFLVPVLFEQGERIAFGWHLFETQPHRYGSAPLPDRNHPWRRPEGWSAVRLAD